MYKYEKVGSLKRLSSFRMPFMSYLVYHCLMTLRFFAETTGSITLSVSLALWSDAVPVQWDSWKTQLRAWYLTSIRDDKKKEKKCRLIVHALIVWMSLCLGKIILSVQLSGVMSWISVIKKKKESFFFSSVQPFLLLFSEFHLFFLTLHHLFPSLLCLDLIFCFCLMFAHFMPAFLTEMQFLFFFCFSWPFGRTDLGCFGFPHYPCACVLFSTCRWHRCHVFTVSSSAFMTAHFSPHGCSVYWRALICTCK